MLHDISMAQEDVVEGIQSQNLERSHTSLFDSVCHALVQDHPLINDHYLTRTSKPKMRTAWKLKSDGTR
jgi:hypothetical protein